MRLRDLVDPGTIRRAFEQEHGELTWDDLELLAAIEDYHREEVKEGADNGEGR